MKNQKIQVGQTVYIYKVGFLNRNRSSDKITTATVSKVGNKYFYVDSFHYPKFHIDTLMEVTDYTAEYKVFFSEQEIIDRIEYRQKIDEIREYIGQYGTSRLKLNQVRQIHDMIFKKENENANEIDDQP